MYDENKWNAVNCIWYTKCVETKKLSNNNFNCKLNFNIQL